MADWYFHHAAAGANDGTNWANAYTNLSSMSGKAAGDRFFVAHDHAQTQASALTITSPGTEATPCTIHCVNRAGSVPPVAADLRTTATVTTTGAFAQTHAGSISECYGIIFSAGTGSTAANLNCSNTASRSWRYVNCALRSGTTANTGRVSLGSAGGHCILENTTVQFNHTSQCVSLVGRVTWKRTPSAVTGATLPAASMFISTVACSLFCEGVDFSPIGASKPFMNPAAQIQDLVFKDCKFGATPTPYSATPTSPGASDMLWLRSDSGDTNYRTERHNYMGAQTVETTIVMTDGATDGTTPISWKIVTSANTEWEHPFECTPISVWNDRVGSNRTITVEGIWGGGAEPLNTEIWMEIWYFGTGESASQSFRDTCGPNLPLSPPGLLESGSGTWGGSTTSFSMGVNFMAGMIGPVTVYVRVAKPSSTFYINPQPVVS